MRNTKEKVKQTALKLFNEKGAHAVTTNHISEEMKISPGNLYYHYKNKEEIIRSIYRDINDDFQETHQLLDENSFSESFVSMFLSHASIYYRYRFFYLEMSMLLTRDKILYQMHSRNVESLMPKMNFMAENIIKSGKSVKIDPKELKHLLLTGFVLTEFWIPHLFSTGREITEKTVKEYIWNYFIMIKPYIAPQASDLIEKRLKRELK